MAYRNFHWSVVKLVLYKFSLVLAKIEKWNLQNELQVNVTVINHNKDIFYKLSQQENKSAILDDIRYECRPSDNLKNALNKVDMSTYIQNAKNKHFWKRLCKTIVRRPLNNNFKSFCESANSKIEKLKILQSKFNQKRQWSKITICNYWNIFTTINKMPRRTFLNLRIQIKASRIFYSL